MSSESPIITCTLHTRGVDRFENGRPVNKRGQPLTKKEIFPATQFEATMLAHHQDERLMLSYLLCKDGTPTPIQMRVNKAALKPIRESGHDVLAHFIALDMDNHPDPEQPDKKAPWTRETFTEFAGKVKVAIQADARLLPTCLYSTVNGARMVYLLDEPIPVDEVEARIAGLCDLWQTHDVEIDTNAVDWTRLMRVPFTMKDDGPTWDNAFVRVLNADWSRTTAVESLPVGDMRQFKEDQFEAVAIEMTDMPDPAEMSALMISSTGSQSDFVRRAKKLLRGKRCFDFVFGNAKIGKGSRDSTIMRYVGEICSALGDDPTADEMHIMALLYEPTSRMERERHEEPWEQIAWSKVQRVWVQEMAKKQQLMQYSADAKAESRDRMAIAAEGAVAWSGDSDLLDEETRDEALRERLLAICTTRRECFVMRPDGYYHPFPLMQDDARLKSELNRQGWREETLGAMDLALQLGARASYDSITMTARAHKGGQIVEQRGERKMLLPLFKRREDVARMRVPEVEEWLRKLVPSDQFDILCAWIGWSLAFEEGAICALAMIGASGAGKNLLVDGLSSCIDGKSPAVSIRQAIDSYNDAISRSPFIHVEEGWPKAKGGSKADYADSFREMVTNPIHTTNAKYGMKAEIEVFQRVIMSANDPDNILAPLASARDMTAQDVKAVGIRLRLVQIKDAARWHLESIGGRLETDQWMDQDKFASHFLWLYDQRETFGRGSRLLVEGGQDQEELQDMRMQGESSSRIIETLVTQFSKLHNQSLMQPWVREGLSFKDGKFFAVSSVVSKIINDEDVRSSWTQRRVSGAMKQLFGASVQASLRPLGTEQLSHRRWYCLDIELLSRSAREHGIDIDKTLAWMEAQNGS